MSWESKILGIFGQFEPYHVAEVAKRDVQPTAECSRMHQNTRHHRTAFFSQISLKIRAALL
jgi:hypothetical protein